MKSAAALVHQARTEAGLSRKALARRAGIPVSSVSRVEEGAVDPTITMLERMLSAAGRELRADIQPIAKRRSIAGLSDAWNDSPAGPKIDWTRLRGFVDRLHLHPEELETAIMTPPPRSGNDQLDNLLAAIVEKLADDSDKIRPRWCSAIHALPSPWQPPGTPRMIEAAQRSAPAQFKARNIWLSERDLWRTNA